MLFAADISPTMANYKSAEVNFVHIFRQLGTFTAVLSVPYELRRIVYWKQRSLSINVKTNKIVELQADVDFLKLQMTYLESLVENLTGVISGK